jgi:hypothetical protein
MNSFVTENGKGIATFIDPKTAHIRIKFLEGGELPAKLEGFFTSTRKAEQAIIEYIEESKKPIKAK